MSEHDQKITNIHPKTQPKYNQNKQKITKIGKHKANIWPKYNQNKPKLPTIGKNKPKI